MEQHTDLTVVVPTFNEGPNIAELVERVAAATEGRVVEVLFVDDSTDETPAEILRVAATSDIPVRLLHRDKPDGGLSGAVLAGFAESTADWTLVMDGDLQHPPELIPVMLAAADETAADVVVASRYIGGGSSDGLSGRIRHLVSSSATVLTRAMFPLRLRDCTDPMTGFFAVRRGSVDVETLRPRGFKILLEILARNKVSVAEVPFVFGERRAGESKATVRQGLDFVTQLAMLRFGKLTGFAVIGAFGAVANLLIMAGLQAVGVWYLAAAIASAAITIVANFLLQERFVFHDLRTPGRKVWRRFAQSLAFNGSETVIRTTLLWLIVEGTSLHSILVQAVLIAISFVARFLFHSRVVYRPERTAPTGFGFENAEATAELESDQIA
jgi:dolichol-phosphate mannosyltransferase